MRRALASTLCLLLAAAGQPQAADCHAPTTLSQAIAAGHEFVVKARVVRVRPPVEASGVLPVMFSVLREYRGSAPQVLTVDFDPKGDPRPLNFHRGEVYLLSTLPSGAADRSLGNACTFRQLVDVR